MLLLTEAILQIFSSWTVAYHFMLLTRLPSRLILIPFLTLLIFLARSSLPRWKKFFRRLRTKPPEGKTGWGFLAATTALSLFSGVLSLIFSRPDADDFSFFHRALVLIQHLDLPFSLADTTHNISGLPAISIPHVMTSYEPLVAMTASLMGIDPLWAYQNGAGFLTAAMLPIVYVLLYRHFRLGRATAFFAALCALLFLLSDGNLHRSFGNFALVRCWQGKSILFMLLLPVTFLVGAKFLHLPSRRFFTLVFMASISAAGLTSSGLFLLPMLLFSLSVAYLLAYGFTAKHLVRAALLNGASLYCTALAAALFTGLISQPSDTSGWQVGWPLQWWANLDLVVGGGKAFARDILILFLLPLFTLGKPLGRLPWLFSVTLALLLANPLLGPLWVETLKPASYWRTAFLFPLPFCAGLTAAALAALGRRGKPLFIAAALSASVLLSMAFSTRSTALPEDFKPVGEYKLEGDHLAFSRAASALLHDRNLLAPEEIVIQVGLLNPTIRMAATRGPETLHLFGNAGLHEEGKRRVEAQRLAATGELTESSSAAFRQSLRNGVDAIIIPARNIPLLQDLAISDFGKWEIVLEADNYTLLLREAGG